MDIKELLRHVNDLRLKAGLSELTEEEFIIQLSFMQAEGNVKVEKGQVHAAAWPKAYWAPQMPKYLKVEDDR